MGERTTQRHTCSQCHGNGYIAYPGEDCGNCKGQGYLEPMSGGESVCPACNGIGYRMTTRPCTECNEKGFKVSIYETTDFVKQCVPCGGTGWVNEDHVYYDYYGNHVIQRTVECSVCHGRGIITDQRTTRVG